MEYLFIIFQIILLTLMVIQDIIPLGNLNDVTAIKKHIPLKMIILSIIINGGFVLGALIFSIQYLGQKLSFNDGAGLYLLIFYSALFIGELLNWWRPYFRGADDKLKNEFNNMYKSTHIFLPDRNTGIIPNTFHVILHAVTLICLFLAIIRGFN